MSDNIQTDVQDTKPIAGGEEVYANTELPPMTDDDARQSDNLIYEKQNSLAEIANSTFKELCKTLESEQAKLLELEERRKKLQEEMLLLKAEIEEEKQSFNLNIKRSVAENLSLLNSNGIENEEIDVQKLITCYEDDEQLPATARNLEEKNSQEMISAEEHSQHIQKELQNVLNECITEQCVDKSE